MNVQIKTRKLSLNTNFEHHSNEPNTICHNYIHPQITEHNTFHLQEVKVAQNAKQFLKQISEDDPINYESNSQLNPERQETWSRNHYEWVQESPIKEMSCSESKSLFCKPIRSESTNTKSINCLAKFIKKSKLSKSYHDHNLQRPKHKEVLHKDITELIKSKKIKNQEKWLRNTNCFTENVTVIPEATKINRKEPANFCSSYTIPTTYIQMPFGYMSAKNKWVTLNKGVSKRVHTSIGFKNQESGCKFFNVKESNDSRKTTLKKYSTNSDHFEKINEKQLFSRTSPIKVEMEKLRRLIIGEHNYFDVSEKCQINIRGLTRSKTES